LDSEARGRTPTERPHRKVAGAVVMDGKLFCEALKREEGMAGVAPGLHTSTQALAPRAFLSCPPPPDSRPPALLLPNSGIKKFFRDFFENS